MITTPAQRRATAAAFKKREAAGLKRATFWLSEESRAKLDALRASTGKTKDALIAAGIDALGMPAPAENPAPPASVTSGRKRGAAKPRNDPQKPPQEPPPPSPATRVAEKAGKGPQRAPERLSVDVQIGPTAPKPGQRLKPVKAKR